MSKISYPSLNGKFLLVTGATSGIGRGICEELLEQEAIVVGIGRDSSKLDKAILNNQNFNFLEFDLTNIDLIEEELNSCVKEFGKFDGFVSCAGKEETMPLNGYKTQKIKSIFEINLFSSIEILRVLSKKKNSNPNASIVFMSSVMGELGQPGKVGYCSTKAAILGVVKSSALELAKRQIRVNSVSPGIVETPMTKSLFETITEENKQRILDMHPLGIGQIRNIVPPVLFLLSSQSGWITGQNIKIDGGYSIQ